MQIEEKREEWMNECMYDEDSDKNAMFEDFIRI